MDNYFKKSDLKDFSEGKLSDLGKENWDNFLKYYSTVMDDGKLSKREKALIALAIATSEKCPYCIDAYTNTCLDLGISKEEMMEAIHVASAMRAGITLVTSHQMKNIIDELEF